MPKRVNRVGALFKKQKIMKRRISKLALVLLLISALQQANAAIRRVGYFGTPRTGVDYADLQAAHNASAAGDTILLYPGNWTATFSKKIVLIGYGYYTDQNQNLQVITGTSSTQVTLNTGSDNSIFTGLNGLTINNTASNATVAGIVISRCDILILLGSKTYNNWQVTQSVMGLNAGSYGGLLTNWLVSNCILNKYSNAAYTFYMTSSSSQSCLFTNNICTDYNVNFGNANVVCQNTIFLVYREGGVAATYQNNISDNNWVLPNGNGNQNLSTSTMNSNVFVGYATQGSYTDDSRWVLKAGSPAIGTGTGGVDCGIYGGSNPYKLSGIPAIPAFYKLTAPSVNTSGNPYTITFSVRSNN